jgi:8-oxo-dGTP pyrophosphatase MutT (NUDIX family)
LGEDPEQCVAREVAEEVGWQVETGPILDAWLHHIFDGRDVFVVTYGCHLHAASGPPVRGRRASDLDDVPLGDLAGEPASRRSTGP